jgi:hypothetical protein
VQIGRVVADNRKWWGRNNDLYIRTPYQQRLIQFMVLPVAASASALYRVLVWMSGP